MQLIDPGRRKLKGFECKINPTSFLTTNPGEYSLKRAHELAEVAARLRKIWKMNGPNIVPYVLRSSLAPPTTHKKGKNFGKVSRKHTMKPSVYSLEWILASF